MQVKCEVERLVAAIKPPYVLECPDGSYPTCWAPQQTNTELFEVDLKSPEVAHLVQNFRQQQGHLEPVKVFATAHKTSDMTFIQDTCYACTNKHTAWHMTLQRSLCITVI